MQPRKVKPLRKSNPGRFFLLQAGPLQERQAAQMLNLQPAQKPVWRLVWRYLQPREAVAMGSRLLQHLPSRWLLLL
jgi:hypothetical protein